MGDRRRSDVRAAGHAAVDRCGDGQRVGRVLAVARRRNHADRRLHGSTASGSRTETHPDTGTVSVQFKTANREFDPQRLDFRWLTGRGDPARWPIRDDVVVLERRENGNFFGLLDRVEAPGLDVPARGSPVEQLQAALEPSGTGEPSDIEPLAAQMSDTQLRIAGASRSALLRRSTASSQGAASDAGDGDGRGGL